MKAAMHLAILTMTIYDYFYPKSKAEEFIYDEE